MSNLRKVLEAKLGELTPIQEDSELDLLFEMANSAHKFDSKADLQKYISEGVLLNVNKLSSKALSIPCGEYMVLNVGEEYAVMVPTHTAPEIHKESDNKFEVATKDVLQAWNKLERPRVMLEFDNAQPEGGALKNATNLDDLFSKLPRSNAELADDIGVAEPSIGRWTAPAGSESHRTPTVLHIKKIADMTGIGPCRVLQMALNQLSGGTKQKKNTRSGSGGGSAWGGK